MTTQIEVEIIHLKKKFMENSKKKLDKSNLNHFEIL